MADISIHGVKKIFIEEKTLGSPKFTVTVLHVVTATGDVESVTLFHGKELGDGESFKSNDAATLAANEAYFIRHGERPYEVKP